MWDFGKPSHAHRSLKIASKITAAAALTAAVELAAGFAPAAEASAPAVSIVSATTTLGPLAKGFIEARVPSKASCVLAIERGVTLEAESPRVAVPSGLIEFSWVDARYVNAGTRTAIVQCSRTAYAKKYISVRYNTTRSGYPLTKTIAALPVRTTEPPPLTGGKGSISYPAYGTVLVAGSQWFNGHGVNVISNGPPPNYYGYYQCVELVNRFLTQEGFGPVIYGNANQLYADAQTAYYDRHPNGSGYRPVPGDVIVLGGGQYGHVVVVDSVSASAVYVVEQNASALGRNTLSLSGSTVGGEYGMGVIGIIHAKKNGVTTAPPPPTTSPTPAPSPANPPAGSGRIVASPCLNFRSGAAVGAALLGCIPAQTAIAITCTTQGDAVTGPYGTETLWDQTSYNGSVGYVSDAWVYTGTNSAVAGACSGGSGPTYYVYHVANTGGLPLNERSGPGTAYALAGSLASGAELDIVCQTRTASVVSGSGIWDKLTNGAWVSDYYTTTPVYNGFSAPIPQC